MAAWRSFSGSSRCMSLYHAKRYKVSFVESADKANITGNRLAVGDYNVHMLTRIDDKSSWFWAFQAAQRDVPHLAAAPASTAPIGRIDRARPARRGTFLE